MSVCACDRERARARRSRLGSGTRRTERRRHGENERDGRTGRERREVRCCPRASMEVRVVDEGKGRCLFVVACFPCGEVSRSICARRLVSQPWLFVQVWPGAGQSGSGSRRREKEEVQCRSKQSRPRLLLLGGTQHIPIHPSHPRSFLPRLFSDVLPPLHIFTHTLSRRPERLFSPWSRAVLELVEVLDSLPD